MNETSLEVPHMPLFANGEIVGDFIFMIACIVLAGVVWFLWQLPGWIGAAGGSLGLWRWSPSDSEFGRVQEAIALLAAHATELSSKGREEVELARGSLTRAMNSQGFRAENELWYARLHCQNAVHGCHDSLIRQVYRALGLVKA